jgi:transposase
MDGEVLRDDQWKQVKLFVPGGRKGKRGPRSDGRRFFDALLWMARSGARWRDLPERFGPHRRRSGATIAGSRWAFSTACSRPLPAIPTSNG